MKNKILTFVIGLLVGAIITSAGFLIYNKVVANNSEQTEMTQMDGRGMQRPSDGNMDENMGERPEMPSGENGETPPTKPDESNNNTNS